MEKRNTVEVPSDTDLLHLCVQTITPQSKFLLPFICQRQLCVIAEHRIRDVGTEFIKL